MRYNYPDTQINHRNNEQKKITDQVPLSKDFLDLTISNKNIYKPNSKAHQKDHPPWSKKFYPRDASVFQYTQ